MKITLEHISDGQDEIIVRYRERTPGIDSIIRSLGQRRDRLYAEKDACFTL